ncbi:hypothetical protein R1sor_027416 [Riccia sorocarpa]|uniref:Transcriptional regulatory protein n=1 Tax=Riccia sorocarpa TaxID=122646 RepID=A0ABD3GEW2_9MARC
MRASTAIKAIFSPSSLSRLPCARNGVPLIQCSSTRSVIIRRQRLQLFRRLRWGSPLGSLRNLERRLGALKLSGTRSIKCSSNEDAQANTRSWAGIESTQFGAIKESHDNTGLWQYTGSRRLWTNTPLQMGRRSAKIATRKGAQNRKKAKLYGKIGKQIAKVVKEGGPNPTANAALAVLLQTAKQYDVPKDIIERNIKKASDKSQADFVDMTYEVYGLGGVGLVLEVLTDNNNRAAATIRDVVKKGGGKMADPGSVLFNFTRTGVIYVKAEGISSDDLLLAAMDAGAEDVLEPEEDDEEEEEEEARFFKVLVPVDQFFTINQKLKEAGIQVDDDNSGLELFPVARVEPDDEALEMNRALMEKLLDLDDVDAVYSNQK